MTTGEICRLADEELASKVVSEALNRGGDFAELYVERSASTRLPLEEGKIQAAEQRSALGAGVRVIHGERQGYAYSDHLSQEKLLEAARVASCIAEGGRSERPMRVSQQAHDDFYPVLRAPSTAPVREKLQIVQRANEAAYKHDARVRQVQVGYIDALKEILVANSEGLYISDTQTMVRIYVAVLAVEGESAHMGFHGGGGRIGMEFFDRVSPESVAVEAARQALVQIGAADAPAGSMPVV
ncbi:MAG TPA: DNA gyrase modulator, partial [Chthonomonadales bacterium]|nr:DNA gyrase modulator [Chthonomonadales bacterium]